MLRTEGQRAEEGTAAMPSADQQQNGKDIATATPAEEEQPMEQGTEYRSKPPEAEKETAHFRHFSGTTPLAIPSDRAMRLNALSLELQISPQSPNGVILFASDVDHRRAEQRQPFIHSLELEDGIVKYKFSLGGKHFEINQSRDKVPLNERTTVRVLNDGQGKAFLQVGSADPINLIYSIDDDDLLAYPANASSRVFMGGIDPKWAKHFPKMINFIGSIGHLKINGKTVNMDERAEAVEMYPNDGTERDKQTEDSFDQSENQCFNEPCRNGGRCQLTRWEFECHCLDGYAGHLCQLPSMDGICPGGQRLCDEGICALDGDAAQCLCPPGREGKRCESEIGQLPEEEGQRTKGIRFDGKYSFLALPLGFGVEEGKPNGPRPYSIELRLTSERLAEEAQQQQMIGAMVGARGKVISAIGMDKEKLWMIHKEGDEQQPYNKRFLTKRIKQKKTLHLRIEPGDALNEMNVLVEGRQKGVLKGKPGDDGILLLGGMPPRGVKMDEEMKALLEGVVPFEGCVEQLLLNGRELTLAELSRDLYTGANLQNCEERETEATTATTAAPTATTDILSTLAPETTSIAIFTESDVFDTLSTSVPQTTPIAIFTASEDSLLAVHGLREGPFVAIAGTLSPFPDELSSEVPSSTFSPTPDPTTNVPVPYRTMPQRPLPSRPVSEASIAPTRIDGPADSAEIDGIFVGLCDDGTCGTHGICEQVNGTHVVCECRNYYVGQRCEEFRPIEYAAKFDGSAFVVFSSDDFPHLSSEQEEVVEFKLRTRAKYGLIIWQGQQPFSADEPTPDELLSEDYLSIGLLDGHLSFSFELGGGAAQILSENPLDDGKTHSVTVGAFQIKAIRRGRDGWLIVDDGMPMTGRSSGILAMLNVEGHIFVGGVPDLHEMTAGLHTQNFVGCLAELALNGQKMDMMANAIDGRNLRPCRSWQPNRMRRIRNWIRRVRKQRKTANRRALSG